MTTRFYLAPVLCAALITACAPTKTVKNNPETAPAPAAGSTAETPQGTPQTEVAEANVRGSEFSPASTVEAIHFDYDSYALSDAARTTLKKNADYLKEHADLDVLAAGNCDE